MSGFYKILANKARDESLTIALKFRDLSVCGKSKARDQAVTLRSFYNKEARANFKIYERAYHGSKFSGEWLRDLNLVVNSCEWIEF